MHKITHNKNITTMLKNLISQNLEMKITTLASLRSARSNANFNWKNILHHNDIISTQNLDKKRFTRVGKIYDILSSKELLNRLAITKSCPCNMQQFLKR